MKLLLWLSLCAPLFANTYFLSNAGRDSNAGTSPDQPWKSLAHVNSMPFSPGDFILLKRGDNWREQLFPQSSGAIGHQITFAAYGSGANPIVSGADLVSGFVSNGTNTRWCASVPLRPDVVFIERLVATQRSSLALLSQAGQWNWTNGQLCVFSAFEPPANVEAAQRDYGLLLGQTGSGNYITVTNIEFRLANIDTVHIVNTTGDIINSCVIIGAYQFGIFAIGVNGAKVDQLRISNDTISFHGSSGIEISSNHSNVTLDHNTVFGNAYDDQNSGPFVVMAGIYLYNSVQSPNNDLIQYNVSHSNGVAGGNESQGAGIWLDTETTSIVRNNVAFNNVSHGLYLEKNINSVMSDNLSYSNATAANSANITCYADFGVPSTGNTLTGNISLQSHSWGMKLGAYQGGGATQFQGTMVENNIVLYSATLALFVDNGANNNLTDGWNNIYLDNWFGAESHDWIYWAGLGWISTYAELQVAYGGSIASDIVAVNSALKQLERLPINSSAMKAAIASDLGRSH